MSEAITPRWLDRDALARYINAKVNMLSRLVEQGKLPRPSNHLGPRSPRWDIYAVDAAMLKASGFTIPQSTDEAVALACEEITIAARRRKDRPKDARGRIG